MFRQIYNTLKIFADILFRKKAGAFKYTMLSGVVALLLTIIILYLTWRFSGILGDYLSSLMPWDWAQNSLVFSSLIGIAIIVMVFMTFKYLLIILLSPVLSLISEKAEAQFKGVKIKSKFSIANSAARSLRINSRNMIKELFITILLFVSGFIPVFNIVSIPLLFLVQAYFTGFGIMDFYLERHYTFKESISVVYQNKWAAITLGSIFIVMLFIPLLGILVAPYLTTVAGTGYFVSMDKNSDTV